jgi:hypothetical protein
MSEFFLQLFLGTLIGYADGQAFGFSALFGLVQDLKLFTLTLVNGQPVLDQTKYQLAAGIVSLGGAAVRRTESNSIYPNANMTIVTGSISSSISRTASAIRNRLWGIYRLCRHYGDTNNCLHKLPANYGSQVRKHYSHDFLHILNRSSRFFYGFSQVLQPMAIIIVAMW